MLSHYTLSVLGNKQLKGQDRGAPAACLFLCTPLSSSIPWRLRVARRAFTTSGSFRVAFSKGLNVVCCAWCFRVTRLGSFATARAWRFRIADCVFFFSHMNISFDEGLCVLLPGVWDCFAELFVRNLYVRSGEVVCKKFLAPFLPQL